MKRRLVLAITAVLIATGLFLLFLPHMIPPTPPMPGPPLPAYLSTWPWPHAVRETIHPGVTHWLDGSSPDGTTLELFDFDFKANPRLCFEIYDQDQDDDHPYDNFAECGRVGVGQATRHLNQIGRGTVVAAWNGLFYNVIPVPGKPYSAGSHVTPVVLSGQVYYNVGQARWTFGVQYNRRGHPDFKTQFEPNRTTLAHEFTFAAGGAQCLIKDSKPLKLHSFPNLNSPEPRQPVSCAPDEAGYIPNVDWIKTARATMGWSRDSRHLYLLFVKSPGTEGGSVAALHGHGPATGGWTVTDEQRFWLSKGVWGAIHSDGGSVAQLTYRRPDGQYVLLPPLQGRQVYSPDFQNAPQNGTLLYFFVRDSPR